ncbi:MAG: DUF1566 domain-containing protein [Desulfobacteraceae bacterium]|jgi:polar amino acid transport system substrate-binding protein
MIKKALSGLMGVVFLGLIIAAPTVAGPLPVIAQAQKELKKLRYYSGGIDGIDGPLTRKAIVQYQYEMDLPVSGMLDDTTIRSLRRPSLILNTQDFVPFHYKTSHKGEAYGPVPQIVKLACRSAGINCRIILYDEWRMAQEDVKIGKSDGMFVIVWNSARAKWLHRSTAIVETEYGLFVRDDDDLAFDQILKRPSDMDGYTIGVYGPSGTSTSLKNLKTALESKGAKLYIKMESDNKTLFKKLSTSKGKYAVYSNRIVGESVIRGLGLNNIRYSGMHRGLSYYVGFSKQRVPLWVVQKFNKAHKQLVDEGAVMSIMANHSMPTRKKRQAASRSVSSKPRPKPMVPERFRRLELKGVSVVVDEKTCLMWQQSGSDRQYKWEEAVAYVEKLNKENFAHFSDWRLPEIIELIDLIEQDLQKQNRMHIHPIFDALQQSCWSASKRDLDIRYVDFLDGAMGAKDLNDTNFVRAVRTATCDKSR